MADDACTKEVKARYKVWPSARASRAVAKCRKRKGEVRKTEKGTSLRRWAKEKWVDKATGKPCGHSGDAKSQYCRPSRWSARRRRPPPAPPRKTFRRRCSASGAGSAPPKR